MDRILASPALASNFRVFLTAHYCEENIDFLVSVRYLTATTVASNGAAHQRSLPSTAAGVYQRFVADSLNLPGDLRSRVMAEFTSGNCSPSIFDEAVVEIKTLLTHQWVAPFFAEYRWLLRIAATEK